MKRVLSIIVFVAAIAVLMVACKSDPVAGETKTVSYEDTVGLAQFQAWKAVNERVDPIQDYKDGFKDGYEQAVVKTPAKAPARAKTSTAKRSTATQSGSMSSTSTNQAKAKKGWSKSAKYAVIGGAAGGVVGAVVNKRNRVVGGVIGAVLGAGGGYVLGRSQDKKDGRIELQ